MPNLLVKIPATEPGVPAIRQMISEGRNINVTLIFSLDRYNAVIEAYISGLEALSNSGGDVSRVHSVASFFVSRVDTEVDRRIEAKSDEKALAAAGQSGCRASQTGLPIVPRTLLRPALGSPPGQRGAPASARFGPRRPRRTPPTPTCCTWTT